MTKNFEFKINPIKLDTYGLLFSTDFVDIYSGNEILYFPLISLIFGFESNQNEFSKLEHDSVKS